MTHFFEVTFQTVGYNKCSSQFFIMRAQFSQSDQNVQNLAFHQFRLEKSGIFFIVESDYPVPAVA